MGQDENGRGATAPGLLTGESDVLGGSEITADMLEGGRSGSRQVARGEQDVTGLRRALEEHAGARPAARLRGEDVGLSTIPEGERQVAPTGEEAATAWAVERSEWVVSNDQPNTVLYEALVEGYDYQIEFFCREVVRCRTVFVNKVAGGYVAVAWCDSPPSGWPLREGVA
jgi:hypothetical protein